MKYTTASDMKCDLEYQDASAGVSFRATQMC